MQTGIDLNECEVDLNECEIDLNECESQTDPLFQINISGLNLAPPLGVKRLRFYNLLSFSGMKWKTIQFKQ